MTNNIIRIFVSSTFADFHEERRILNETVFPKLERYCRSHGFRFQSVDLRWGVSEQAGAENDTIRICLEELERSQRLSPRPNFFLMMGNRYGWQPIPDAIELREFEELRKELESMPPDWQGLYPATLAKKWYILDENAVPATYLLRPHAGEDAWSQESDVLGKALRTAAERSCLGAEQMEKYILSATGLEILKGALSVKQRRWAGPVICFFREIDSIDCHVDIDTDKAALLKRLKDRLQQKFPQYSYHIKLGKRGKSRYLMDFARRTEEMLQRAVDLRMEQAINALAPELVEAEQHLEFADERDIVFMGREQEQVRAASYAKTPEGRVMTIHGVRGVGKSAFAAHLFHHLQNTLKESVVIARFVGATAQSSDAYSLVNGLIASIRAAYGAASHRVDTYQQAVEQFSKVLTLANAEHPLVILVDALDQLNAPSGEEPLLWLPKTLPPHVSLILGTQTIVLEKATGRLHNPLQLSLFPLSPDEISAILEQLLFLRGRMLTANQTALVLQRCKENGLPLYLKLSFEQAANWRSFDSPSLSASMEGLIQDYFKFLSSESRHGQTLVRRALGYILLGLQGLSEQELLHLLGADPVVMGELARRSPNSPKTKNFPFMVWARLFGDLASYFKEVVSGEELLMTFYHMQIQDAAKSLLDQALSQELHERLRDYYHSLPLYDEKGQKRPNLRRLSALPYHLRQLSDLEGMKALLTDEAYLTAKVRAGALSPLIEEFVWAAAQMEEPQAKELAGCFFQFVITYHNQRRKKDLFLDWEELHTLLIFRQDRSFHTRFFSQGEQIENICALVPQLTLKQAQEVQRLCTARRINYLRRNGDLSQAERLASVLLEQLEDDASRAKLLYDIGYIRFLMGQFQEGVEAMELSAQASKQAGDVPGACFSHMVGIHIDAVSSLFTPDSKRKMQQYLETIQQAEAVFRKYASTHRNADRWMANVWEHRGLEAYYRGDLQDMQIAQRNFQDVPFVRGWDDPANQNFLDARLLAMEGNYAEACGSMETFIAYKLDRFSIQAESLAQLYYLLGDWCEKAGFAQKSWAAWQNGIALPDEPGNHVWKREMKQRLKAYS